MGYRHYLHAVDKNLIEKIQKCTTNEEWCDRAASLGYKVDYEATGDGTGYFPPHSIGTEIYGLGKYSEIGSWLENNRTQLFTTEELKQRYEDYAFVLLSAEDFKLIIEAYVRKITDYFQYLLDPKPDPILNNKIDKEKLWEHTIQNKLESWQRVKFAPVLDLNLDNPCITRSWEYEYAVFELVRLYKTFDWENNALVLMGW